MRVARQFVLHVCLAGALSAGVGIGLALWSGATAATGSGQRAAHHTATLVAAAFDADQADAALRGDARAAEQMRERAARLAREAGAFAIHLAPLADPTVAPMLPLWSSATVNGPTRSPFELIARALREGGTAIEPLGQDPRLQRAVIAVRDRKDVAHALAIIDLAVPDLTPTPLGAWPLVLGLTLAGAFAAAARRRFAAPLASIEREVAVRAARGVPENPEQLAAAVAELAVAAQRVDDELEERVRVRTRELETQCRVKDEITANTVHELRTPLTTILASLGIVVDGIAETDEERQQFLGNALVASRHLMFLCNDILDTAAYEAGKLHMDIGECAVAEVLQEVDSLMRPIAISRGVELHVVPCSEPLAARADRNRMLQVIFNLVSNAVKYSRQSGHVIVRAQRAGNSLAIEVEDDGLGVPVASRDKLFTKFSRMHTESSSVSGTGIGLYLCRVLVEHMQGSIGFDERSDGPGSVFWFTLPLVRGKKADLLAARSAR